MRVPGTYETLPTCGMPASRVRSVSIRVRLASGLVALPAVFTVAIRMLCVSKPTSVPLATVNDR